MSDIKTVDGDGRPIKLTNRQKNTLYGQAKSMRGHLSDSMCTHSESMNPTHQNMNKMRDKEFRTSGEREKYNKIMRAIGADPKDCSAERLRKRR